MARKPKPIRHGTIYAYKDRGCRCEKCRRANADSCRARRQRKGKGPAGCPVRSMTGQNFPSQRAAGRELGVSGSTICYHLNAHGNLDRLGCPPGGAAPGRCKPISVYGRTWPSNSALARYVGVRPQMLHNWIRRGQMDRLLAALMVADAAAARAA